MNHNSFAALLIMGLGKCPSMESLSADVVPFLDCSRVPVLPPGVAGMILVVGH